MNISRLNESNNFSWFGKYFDLKGTKKFIYITKDLTRDVEEASQILEDRIPEPFTKFVFCGSISTNMAKEQGAQLVESKIVNETYHINDEEVMNKVAELGKELESQGFKYVNSKDSRDYYDFYRKIEDGKGIWKAVIYNYGAAEIIDVTYEQARGIEPIDSLEQL